MPPHRTEQPPTKPTSSPGMWLLSRWRHGLLRSQSHCPHLQQGPGSIKQAWLAPEDRDAGGSGNAGTRCSKAPPAPLHGASAAFPGADSPVGCTCPRDVLASPAHIAMEGKLLPFFRGRKIACVGVMADEGAPGTALGHSRARGARRGTQGPIAVREWELAEQREQFPPGCLQEGEDEGKLRESCQLMACAGQGCGAQSVTRHARQLSQHVPACARRLHPPVPPSLHDHPGTAVGVSGQWGAEVKGAFRPLSRGRVVRGRPGHWCFPAVPGQARRLSYPQSPRCHISGCLEPSPASLREGVAGRWGSSALTGCWGPSLGQGLLLASAPKLAPRGRAGGALRRQGSGGARRSPTLLLGTSQEHSPVLSA